MYCFPVSPTGTTRIREADPITMPREVSITRTLLVRKLSIARLTISLSTIVRLALARVRSKDLRLTVRIAGICTYGKRPAAVQVCEPRKPQQQNCRPDR